MLLLLVLSQKLRMYIVSSEAPDFSYTKPQDLGKSFVKVLCIKLAQKLNLYVVVITVSKIQCGKMILSA